MNRALAYGPLARRTAICFAVLLLLALIAKPVWDGREQWHLGQNYDDSVYWLTAKSLAGGNGYRLLNLPGEPYAVKYPPLYPLYLSIAWRLNPEFPQNLGLASLLQAALVPVYLILLLFIFRGLGFSWRRTLLVSAMVMATVRFVLASVTLLSELLFGCLLLAAILAVDCAVKTAGARSRLWVTIGGLAAGLAFLTRSAALPLFVAVPVFLIIRKRTSLNWLFLAAAAPAVLGWEWWVFANRSVNGEANISYLQEYGRVIASVGFLPNLLKQTAGISAGTAENFFWGIGQMIGGLPLYHVVLAAALAGGIRLARRRNYPLVLLFTALYLVMLACWWFESLRLLLPVWPALLAGISEEASHFSRLCERSWARSSQARRVSAWMGHAPRWALLCLGALIVLRNDVISWHVVSSMASEEHIARTNDEGAYAWVARNAQKDAVVLAWKDAVSFLYSGVPSSHPLFVAVTPQPDDTKALGAGFSELPPRYKVGMLLLLASDLPSNQDPVAFNALRKAAESLPGSNLVYSTPSARIYSFPVDRLSARAGT